MCRNQLMRELQQKMEATEQISAFMASEKWINYQANFHSGSNLRDR